jgi:hypothetical protein
MMSRSLLLLSAGAAAAGCATTSTPASAPSRALQGPDKPAFVAADFENATAGAIDEKLGPPALTRVEGTGEFRRYTLARCVLIAILYPDDKGERRVATLHAGALVSGEDAPKLDECLAAGKAD